MLARTFAIALITTALACASAGSGAPRRDSSLITEEQVAASHESNAYDVVQHLHPNFLRSRGKTTLNSTASEYASVFMDGQFYGDLGALRNIIAPMIKEIRYYNGPNAVTRFGMQYGSGVIEVKTK